MDLLAALRTNQLAQFKETFTWRTKDGRTVRIPDMDTTHLFNTAKLLLNKFSSEQIANLYRRGPNSYACQAKNGQTIFFFVWEIENRDDLPPKYRIAYQQMLERIFDPQFIFQDLPPAIVRQRPGAPIVPPRPIVAVPTEESRRGLIERLSDVMRPRQDVVPVDYGEMERRVLGRFEPPEHVNSRSEASPLAIHEDMVRLGTMALTPEHMREMIERGTRYANMDLDLWLSTVPDQFREGAQWAADQVRRRNRHYGRRTEEAIMSFIYDFQGFKQRGIAAGDLTRNGWITPAAYRTPAERERQAREDERRGRGRRLSLEYIEMMQRSMSPDQFERELMGRLAQIPGNMPVIEEFRERERARRRTRMSEITAGRSEGLQGRNPLLMVIDEVQYAPGNFGGATNVQDALNTLASRDRPQAKVETPGQTVEQLTQIGKRKIQIDGDDK